MVQASSSSSSAQRSSSLRPPATHKSPSINAFSPLEFCEILHAYWIDRSAGTLVSVPEDPLPKTKKGKGRATSSSSAPAPGLSNGQMQRKRLIREGKSFYAKVDLAASQSCVRHIEALQLDPSIRKEVEKLVSLAQTSSTSAANVVDSANPPLSPAQSGSPSKRHFRTAQQLLHADARAATLEQRIFLRLLLSRTVLRYIEKHTGCKYLYQGDRVMHYRDAVGRDEQDNGVTSLNLPKKARCVFWYECASGQYEPPACGGTLRIVVDLDLAAVLIHKETSSNNHHNDEGAMSLDDSEDREAANAPSANHSKTLGTRGLPETPATRVYGSKGRLSIRLSSIPLSSRSTKQVNSEIRSSAVHPTASASAENSHNPPFPPFVIALRLTHVKAHREPYSVLRKRFKEGRLEGQAKLDRIQAKMDMLSKELESLKRLEEDKDDMYERGVEKLWNKIKRATTPTESESESDNDDGHDQEVGEKDITATEEDDQSSSHSSESEQEVIVVRSTARTRQKRNPQDGNDTVSPPPQGINHPTTSARPSTGLPPSRITVVRDVESLDNSGEEDELHESQIDAESYQHHPANDSVQTDPNAQSEDRSFSPSHETDYSEPEHVNTRAFKKSRQTNGGQGSANSSVKKREEGNTLAKNSEARPVRGAGRSRGRPRGSRGSGRARKV